MTHPVEIDKQLDLSPFTVMNDLAQFVMRTIQASDAQDYLRNELIKEDSNYSQSLGFLVLFALWLQTQPLRLENNQPISRDDWSWLQHTIKTLHGWAQQFNADDEEKKQTNLSIENTNNILRLLNHLEFFQHTSNYLTYKQEPPTQVGDNQFIPGTLSTIGEGDVHLSLEISDRKLKLDYQISGLFHPTDFYKPLQQGKNLLDMLTQGTNLVIIGSDNDSVQLIRLHKHYYYYDGSASNGKNLQIIEDDIELATLIFQRLTNEENKYEAIDCRVFSFEEGKNYIPAATILNQTKAVLTRDIHKEQRNPFVIPAQNGDFESIYFYAAILGREKTKKFLRENVEDDWTVLHYAIMNGRVVAIEALINEGADVNHRSKKGQAYTPLGLATIHDQTRGMELLLESGAGIEMPNKYGNKAIHLAVVNDSLKTFELLFEQGAELNCTNDQLETPLFLAIKKEKWEMANRLIRLGAMVDTSNVKGLTPLHLAVLANNARLIKVLIDAGANVHVRNKNGKKPIDLTQKASIKNILNSYTRHGLLRRASDRIFEHMLPIRRENILKNKYQCIISMNNSIDPPIRCKKANITTLSKPNALYIEAIHEIFQEKESITTDEQDYLLHNINDLLDSGCVCYLDLPQSERQSFLEKVSTLLGSHSSLAVHLKTQMKKGTTLDDFKALCRIKEITQLQIGGVYGKACVWDAARQLGKNIYAKCLGDKHPNIRYADLQDEFQFEDVYINETITQGFLYPENMIFPEYVLFSQWDEPHFLENITSAGTIEAFEDEMANMPSEIGLVYDEQYSDIKNPENHRKINQIVFDTLFGQSIQNGLYPGFFTPRHNDELDDAAELLLNLSTQQQNDDDDELDEDNLNNLPTPTSS